MIVSTMRLVEVGPVKCLAGHDTESEAVYVLRKESPDTFTLHRFNVDDDQQSLRSFLAAGQSTEGELVAAIIESGGKPTKLRKRKRPTIGGNR